VRSSRGAPRAEGELHPGRGPAAPPNATIVPVLVLLTVTTLLGSESRGILFGVAEAIVPVAAGRDDRPRR